MPAPTLDGSATGTRSTANTISATLTTTQTNDIIVAVAHFELNNTPLYATGVAGGGLAWQFRSRAITAGALPTGARSTLEVWWAVAPGILSSQTITLTINASFDDASLIVFGVHGCNTTNPWDANASLPARQFNAVDASAPAVTGVSTSNANDFLLCICGSASGSNPSSNVPVGYTLIANAANSGGSNFSFVSAAYQGVTTQQANQTVTWGATVTNYNVLLVEALTADAGGSTAVAHLDLECFLVAGYAGGATTAALPACATAAGQTVLIGANANTAGITVSSVSGAGLTWTRRSRSNGSAVGDLEIWSATASAPFASSTITVTFSGTVAAGAGGLNFSALVNGASAQLFDANASVPAHTSNPAGTGPWTPSATVSTSQANDLIFAFVVTNAAATAASLYAVPAGLRCAGITNYVVGSSNCFTSLAYQLRSATVTSAAVTWGSSLLDSSGGSGGEYIVDAITADTATAAGATQARVMVMA